MIVNVSWYNWYKVKMIETQFIYSLVYELSSGLPGSWQKFRRRWGGGCRGWWGGVFSGDIKPLPSCKGKFRLEMSLHCVPQGNISPQPSIHCQRVDILSGLGFIITYLYLKVQNTYQYLPTLGWVTPKFMQNS